MRTSMRLAAGFAAALLLVINGAAFAQDAEKPAADVPMTEKIARNNDARQKGEPLPFPEAEAEADAERMKAEAAARVNRRALEGRAATPAISPAGAAGTPAAPPEQPPTGNGTRVAFSIGVGDEDWGTIVVELFDDRAPQTVANFLRYVDSGFYNGTLLHRIKPRYVVQGGGFVADLVEKTDGLQPPVPNEAARTGEKNKKGTIAVARGRNDPNSGTSQYFFNLVDNPRLDHSAENPGYCVFGRIVEGIEVLDKIATQRVRRSTLVPNEISQPMTPPQVKTVRRLAPGETASAPQPAAAEPAPTPAPQPGEHGGNTGEDDGKRDTSGEEPPKPENP